MAELETPFAAEDEPETSQASIFAGYIPEPEYARQRKVSVRTCQRDRALRRAPPHVMVGNSVYYRVDAVRRWLLERERAASTPASRRRATGRR